MTGLTKEYAITQLTDIQQKMNPDKEGQVFEGWYLVHNMDKVKLQLNP
jgi:hypothetical protein